MEKSRQSETASSEVHEKIPAIHGAIMIARDRWKDKAESFEKVQGGNPERRIYSPAFGHLHTSTAQKMRRMNSPFRKERRVGSPLRRGEFIRPLLGICTPPRHKKCGE